MLKLNVEGDRGIEIPSMDVDVDRDRTFPLRLSLNNFFAHRH